MRTRNSYFQNNSSVIISKSRNKRRTPNVVEPELRTVVEVAPMANNRTMEELLQAPAEGYGEAFVIPKINADHFEIKTNLLQLVQANPYHGFERENPHIHINNFKRITSTLKFKDVPNNVIKLMMFPYSLEGSARVWYDKEHPNSILTWEDLVNKFVNHIFLPRKPPTSKIKSLVSLKDSKRHLERHGNDLRKCLEHAPTTDLRSGNLLSKTTREALQIIENKSKVRYSRNKPNVSRMNTTSRENASKTNDRIDKLADQISTLVDIYAKKVVTPAPVKAVEESCVTCGGAHAYYNCPNTDRNQPIVCVATGTYNQVAPQNRASNYMAPPGFALVENSQNRFNQNQGQASTSGTLPSNTIPNLKGEMKAITTRSGITYEGPSIPTPKKVLERETEETTDKEQTNFQGSTAHIQPPDKLFELAKISLNENRLTMLLKKLPEKLEDPEKFHIPCDFSGMDVCHSLADLGASINLMPLSIWKKLSLPELTPTRMTLELADRSITRPKGVAEDVFIKVGKFYFPTDFIVVDFEADPRTTRYSSTYDDLSVNRIDIIDVAREEYAQEILSFSNNSSGGNPTSTFEPILLDSSPSLTPFEGSDFILKEIEAYLKDESISLEIDHADCDPKGDICLIEKLLNNDPF
uniref:Reverse transcriptase domain-containing protein n=1 Tax=Tanacetum cinerariifolium TaxID=118510 RepID=A0A6L2MNE2_TANCI|nr:reverse transcriptase domain-containing protein [Tanacetum cinerariifolium]